MLVSTLESVKSIMEEVLENMREAMDQNSCGPPIVEYDWWKTFRCETRQEVLWRNNGSYARKPV